MHPFQPNWRRCALATAICLCATTSVSCAHYAHHPFTRPEQECYNAISTAHAQEEAAISRKDVDGAMAICSPNFVGTSPTGQTGNYAQVREAIVNLYQVSSEVKETNVIQDIHLTGATAIVMVKNHVEATLPISNPLTGRPITRAQDHLDRETWVKGPQGWLLTKSDILQSSS